MFKFSYLEIIRILDERLVRFSINFFAFSFFHKKSIFLTARKWNKKTLEMILGESVIYGSMRLHLLFLTVKTAVLYLVSIKHYSKNTHEHSCYLHICERNRSYRNFIIVISIE
jgi:hypothetical protein